MKMNSPDMANNTELHEVDMDKLCKGCLMYEARIKNPEITMKCTGYIVKDVGCPCINCLIKMMCSVACDKLENRNWEFGLPIIGEYK